jgi:threonine dehydrogenase-like Zn-dependent dehydrogenase
MTMATAAPAVSHGLYVDAERRASLRAEPLPPLGPDQARVRTEFASLKHGTEFANLSGGGAFEKMRFDGDARLFVPAPTGGQAYVGDGTYVGNTVVGTVTQVGESVTAFRRGDRVYCYAPARDMVTVAARDLRLLTPPLTPEDAVCLDPALYAYAAVRDARVTLGDRAVVFGLGAIGLLAVQMLRAAGCLDVVAVDPLPRRRERALDFGAHAALDPSVADVAVAVRERGGGAGADVAIEASGSYRALREAMRAVGRCARVVTLGYYKGRDTELELGREWMHNRLELISSMPTWGNPPREYPLWTEGRLVETVVELFRRGVLRSNGLLDPVVDFADAPRAFEEVYRDPSRAVKLGIRFPAAS